MAVVLLAAASLPAAASAEVTGLTMVSADSAYNSIDGKQKAVACPSGTKVLGTAAALEHATGRVAFEDITPASTLTAVGVTALEDSWKPFEDDGT